MFSFFTFSTFSDGSVVPGGAEADFYPASDIVADFTIEETVGDEFYIKAGDLTLRHLSPIKRRLGISPPRKHWILVTLGSAYTDPIVGVYQVPEAGFEEYDHLSGIYSSRLKSAQQVFFEDIAATRIQYTTDTDAWAYGLSAAIVSIENLKIKVGDVVISSLNRYGFSLKSLITALTGRHDDKHYGIASVAVNSLPGPNLDNLPVIFRGQSKSVDFETVQDAVDYTFYQTAAGENYDIYWKTIFEMASFAVNGYLRAVPDATQLQTLDKLSLKLTLTPRTGYAVPLSPGERDWYERKLSLNRFQIDGVRLEGKNFEYQQGTQGGKLTEKTIDITDPAANVETSDELYWAVGDYNSTSYGGYPEYSILDGGGDVRPYFAEGLVEPYYDGMITEGHGYTGKIPYSGEISLDFIEIIPGGVDPLGDTIQLNRISISPDGIATIEGAKV